MDGTEETLKHRSLMILVTSSQHRHVLVELAKAARSKGVIVKIHFVGNGVLLADSGFIAKLSRFGDVFVCRESQCESSDQGFEDNQHFGKMDLPTGMGDALNRCDRYVVL